MDNQNGLQQGNMGQVQQAYQQPVYQQPIQQPTYQQPVYQQPVQQYTAANDVNTVSTSDWFWSILLLCIPLVNIIMMFVWGFGSSKPSKKNFGKAMLIWMLVSIGIGIIGGIIVLIVSIAGGVGLAALFDSMTY